MVGGSLSAFVLRCREARQYGEKTLARGGTMEIREGQELPHRKSGDSSMVMEAARVRAYRQARIFEPSIEGYHAAMAVYVAAFGKPDGEPEVVLPDGTTKQSWEFMAEELLIDQRCIGHGEGQEQTIADVNAGRIDDLITPRLDRLRRELQNRDCD